MRRLAFLLTVTLTLLATSLDTNAGKSPTCNDAGMLSGGIVSRVCWSCFYPIAIGGTLMGGTELTAPTARARGTCVCPGRIFGYPTTGITLGMFQPTHLIETTRQPYCSPSIGGTLTGSASTVRTGLAGLTTQGGAGYSDAEEGKANAYWNFHWFKFPIGQIIDQMTDAVCVSQTGSDMDLLFISEILPTWNNDELALYTSPETPLFASPVAVASCIADAAAASVYKPIDAMFWCSGSWGPGLYPYSGTAGDGDSIARSSSLAATKGLALMHRLGLQNKTMGQEAVCHSIPFPNLIKSQYRFQTAFPIPELVSNHWIGASTFRWFGEERSLPSVGEDWVHLQWTWIDCCANL